MIPDKLHLLQHLKYTDKSAREDFCTQMQVMLEEDGFSNHLNSAWNPRSLKMFEEVTILHFKKEEKISVFNFSCGSNERVKIFTIIK